jgi:outer membrane protein OmpA-like peptidoglycan-associated protein
MPSASFIGPSDGSLRIEDATPALADLRESDDAEFLEAATITAGEGSVNADAQHAPEMAAGFVLKEFVKFEPNSWKIGPDSAPILRGVASFLNEHPEYARVRVRGHADDTGSEEANIRLAQARAFSVRTLLIGYGVEAKRLDVTIFGELWPKQDAETDEARAENRRVDLCVKN